MDYLFSINKKGTLIFHPDAMSLCPELSVLTDDEKLCVVLVVDYASPYNQLPEQDRRHKASNQVFGKADNKFFDRQIIKNAIEAYKSLQYDPKRELLKVYQDKIEQLSRDLVGTTSSKAISDILNSQAKMRVAIEEISNDIINIREAKVDVRGGGKLSFLDELMQNKEAYERVTKKK